MNTLSGGSVIHMEGILLWAGAGGMVTSHSTMHTLHSDHCHTFNSNFSHFVLSNFLIITFTNIDDFNPIKTSDEVYTSLS